MLCPAYVLVCVYVYSVCLLFIVLLALILHYYFEFAQVLIVFGGGFRYVRLSFYLFLSFNLFSTVYLMYSFVQNINLKSRMHFLCPF